MVRLRIALGVASSLVAVAALTIVFSGTGQAQGNVKESNVNVVNTPLPVTGDLVVSGNVSANITNPANNPVLVRSVDGKELWQENRQVVIPISFPDAFLEFSPVPAGKVLVIEHVNVRVADSGSDAPVVSWMFLANSFKFGATSPDSDWLTLVTQTQDETSVADTDTKFYVAPGAKPQVYVARTDLSTHGSAIALLTGYLVDYP